MNHTNKPPWNLPDLSDDTICEKIYTSSLASKGDTKYEGITVFCPPSCNIIIQPCASYLSSLRIVLPQVCKGESYSHSSIATTFHVTCNTVGIDEEVTHIQCREVCDLKSEIKAHKIISRIQADSSPATFGKQKFTMQYRTIISAPESSIFGRCKTKSNTINGVPSVTSKVTCRLPKETRNPNYCANFASNLMILCISGNSRSTIAIACFKFCQCLYKTSV